MTNNWLNGMTNSVGVDSAQSSDCPHIAATDSNALTKSVLEDYDPTSPLTEDYETLVDDIEEIKLESLTLNLVFSSLTLDMHLLSL